MDHLKNIFISDGENSSPAMRATSRIFLCFLLAVSCQSSGPGPGLSPILPDRSESAAVVFVARPKVSGGADISSGARALMESFLTAGGLAVIPSSDIIRLNTLLGSDENDPAALCEYSGADACIVPEITIQADQATVSLRWLSRDENELVVQTPGPSRDVSQLLYRTFVLMMEEARNQKLIREGFWSAQNQNDASRMVKPQMDSLKAFSRGLDLEKENSSLATIEYRKALAIDPDFLLPYARLFYTCYESMAYPAYAEGDITNQTRVRLDADTVVPLGLAFRDLGVNALRKGWTTAAEAYFRRTMTLLSTGRREANIAGVLALYGLADLSLKGRNNMGSLYFSHAAQMLLETMGGLRTFLSLEGEIRLGSAYIIDAKNILALYSYNRALDHISRPGLESYTQAALVRADLGSAKLRSGDRDGAIEDYESAMEILSNLEMTNSHLYLSVLLHYGIVQRLSGNLKDAETSFNHVLTSAKILGLDQTSLYGEAAQSAGLMASFRGDEARGRYLTSVGQEILNRNGGLRDSPDFFSLENLPVKNELEMLLDEGRLLSSYCESFNFALHSRQIQARTYEGRLDDTNVLLKDLLDEKKTDDEALTRLRTQFILRADVSGAGIVFVDIGPAIANLASPAVTTVSIARDFPAMEVIAMDLPEQVAIFRQTVAPVLRNRLLSFPNFNVVSGNGVHPFSETITDQARWIKSEKTPSALNGRPIIFRAANSIDIYETWDSNRAALARLAGDFPESPILYLFNRSILFKPARSHRFRIIGIISPAGFDHMYETFDRHGEKAYMLSSSVY